MVYMLDASATSMKHKHQANGPITETTNYLDTICSATKTEWMTYEC